MKYISAFFFGVRDLLNGLTNTVWGVAILFTTMWIFVHEPNGRDAAYYFAGVASTLLGIKQEHPQTTNFNNSTVRSTTPMNSQTIVGPENTDGKS